MLQKHIVPKTLHTHITMSIVVLVVSIWICFIVSKVSIAFFAFTWVYVEENPYRYNHNDVS